MDVPYARHKVSTGGLEVVSYLLLAQANRISLASNLDC